MSQRMPGWAPPTFRIPDDLLRYAHSPGPVYARVITETPDVCYIQYKPEIEAAKREAARLNWNMRQQPVSDPPPQHKASQGGEKWYNEVKNLNTKDFSQTEAKKDHSSSPMFCPPGVAYVGSPTDPKPTLPYLPTPRSYIAGSMYASSWSSCGGPSISARSSHPAWSVSSRTALPKLYTKGHRHEPYELGARPGRAPRAPRAQYEPQPRHNEMAPETAASAAEPTAGPAPAAPTLHDELPHRFKEVAAHSGPAISVPKPRCESMSKAYLKGHRQEPYATSKRPRARPAPSVPEIHEDLPYRVKGKARETAASADDAGAALPIREKQPVVDKDEET
uniref:Uncharacterized protein n=1 Tax=Bionectria ochroleuca TaxID=29856 RepID=A0A8H7KCD8_BIOOC